jgi:hypothetical protein
MYLSYWDYYNLTAKVLQFYLSGRFLEVIYRFRQCNSC